MKKIGSFIFLSFFLFVIPQFAHAYDPGLLYGKSGNYVDARGGKYNDPNVTVTTDGDLSTSQFIFPRSHITYTFEKPVSFDRYYIIGGNSDTYMYISYFGTDRTDSIRSVWGRAPGAIKSLGKVYSNVKSIRLQQNSAVLVDIHAIEVYPAEDLEPPAVPSGLTAQTDNQTVNLSWRPNSEGDLSHYVIYQDDLKIGTSQEPNYYISGLVNGQEYIFQVSAVDLSGNESNKSAGLKVIPNYPPPAAPTGLTVVRAENKEIEVRWNPNEENYVAGYVLYISGSGISQEIYTERTNYVFSKLRNQSTYTIQVSAKDTSERESERSEAVSATVIDTIPPPNPVNVTAYQTSPNYSAMLTWEYPYQVDDLKGFIVYKDGQKLYGPANVRSYQVSNLEVNNQYTFEVSAVDTSDNESQKVPVTIEISDKYVYPPVDLKASADFPGGKIIVSWKTPEPEPDSYIIYRNGEEIGRTSSLTYEDTEVEDGTGYQYDVSSVLHDMESEKATVRIHYSKHNIDFGDNPGLTPEDLLRGSVGYLLLFVSFILLVLSIRFAPQLTDFLNRLIGRSKPAAQAAAGTVSFKDASERKTFIRTLKAHNRQVQRSYRMTRKKGGRR